jgi:Ca2+/Na+ antiporter
LAYGIIGALLFLVQFISAFRESFKLKDTLFLLFTLLFLINCLTESMLQAQSGVVFYLFFLSYFVFGKRNVTNSTQENAIN